MCGIIGIVSKKPDYNKKWLSIGIEALKHRGPDDSGEEWMHNNCVGFGHRRLSIIDISSAGHQPMSDEKSIYTIVFNGEIYNFKELRSTLLKKGRKFRSNTDTEVVLQSYSEWGVDCVSKLNGMFAFSIFDRIKKILFFARDRSGEKPLYYYKDDHSFRFTSELKGILSDSSIDRNINYESLDCYLAMGFVPDDKCILEGFKKLPPATAMTYSLETSEIYTWKYWSPPKYIKYNYSQDYLVDKLEILIEDSIRRQLVSDVPIGILLSGGVDSSIVTAIASRILPRVKTFTVNFPNSGKFDEREHARLIANYFKTDHMELEVMPPSPDLLKKLARQYDEPIVDSSMIPTYLVSKLVSKYCKVVLGGDGGDELFGGYEHHSRLLWVEKYTKFIPQFLLSLISNFATNLLSPGFKGRNWLQAIDINLSNDLPLLATYFDKLSRKKLLSKYTRKLKLISESYIKERVPSEVDLIQRVTRMDFNNFLPEDVLTKVDRASMLNSLEIRAPFLDKHVIEFAFHEVPPHMKTTINDRKIILKKLAKKILPPDFDFNRKQGFSAPMNQWLSDGYFRDYFDKILLDPSCVFNRSAVTELLKNQDKGHNNSERLFSMVMFELWRNEYDINL